MAHIKDGDSARAALRHALADAQRSFEGLRRRPPRERYELPCASMMFAVACPGGFDALWYGDCSALVLAPDGALDVVGDAFARREAEIDAARAFVAETKLGPVEALKRSEYIAMFRSARADVNAEGGNWLFSPEPAASEHVFRRRIAAPPGTYVLLCSDGFLALALYGIFQPSALIEAARDEGLAGLGEKLRAAENADPDGFRLPRFKKSDDASAVLLKLV
jgi:hypothetical protein